MIRFWQILSLGRLSSRRVAALIVGLVDALGFNVKVAAWNNLPVGSVVFLLAIYQDRKDSESSR